MTDYKQMYLTLFHATEEAIDLLSLLPPPLPEKELRRKVKHLLTQAQQRAEDIYIDTCGDEERSKRAVSPGEEKPLALWLLSGITHRRSASSWDSQTRQTAFPE